MRSLCLALRSVGNVAECKAARARDAYHVEAIQDALVAEANGVLWAGSRADEEVFV